jgi:hypothetical protein
MTFPPGRWRLIVPVETFATLKTDKEFLFLATLCRMVNAAKFGVSAMNDHRGIETPASDRQRMGSFLYTAGVINELTEFVVNQKEVWGGLTAFGRAFDLLDEDQVDTQTREVLHTIRNRQAFHFDPTVAERVLPRIPNDEYPLVTGVGPGRLDANYELADVTALAFVFGHLDDVDELYRHFRQFYGELSRLVVRFIEAADNVIIDRLLARGGTIRASVE